MVTGVGAGAGGVGAGVVGGGVTVVGVAVGVSWQVQVGEAVGDDGDDCGPEGPPGVTGVTVAVGCDPPLGDVDASAECEANTTVKLVAASAMLASPAILARFVSFNAVTRFLLAAGKSGAQTVGLRPVAPLVNALQCAGVLLGDTRGQCYRKMSMVRVSPLRGYRIVTIRLAALTLDRWA
ncbi:MAG: hypothetical protein ACRDL9_01980 [Trebonia sp.]